MNVAGWLLLCICNLIHYFKVTQSTEGESGRRSTKEIKNGGKSVSDEDAVEVTVRFISK